jgi:hypothetical protein
MATAHQIRDLIAQTKTGSVRPRFPREVRDEVCRYAARRRREGAAQSRARRSSAVTVLRPVEVLPAPEPEQGLALIAPSGVRIEGLRLEQAAQLLRLLA